MSDKPEVHEQNPSATAEEVAAEEAAQVKADETARSIELAEEAKLRARMPLGNRPASAFLQKRLGKGQKYFDSGDYQMARQKPLGKSTRMPPLFAAHPTGDAIPTPETVPQRKTSIIQQPKLGPQPPQPNPASATS